MGTRLRRQVDKLDGQTELYLVLCLLGIALLMILMLVACNCALTCCQCRSNRKRGKRRSREGNDDQYDDDYFHQIHSLLQRQQTVEHEWEERRRIRDEYRMLTPEQARASLSQLTSRASSPARTKRNKPLKSSLKMDNELKDELANYRINHSVRIRSPEDDTVPTLKRKSWSAILDGKEIELNEEDLIGGSMVIVRRFEPMKIVDTQKKDKQHISRQPSKSSLSSKKRRSQRPSIETIV